MNIAILEIHVAGSDGQHTVENLTFENVARSGKAVTAESPSTGKISDSGGGGGSGGGGDESPF